MSSRGRPPKGSAPAGETLTAQVRGRMGLTQAEFADALGIPVASVRNWEAGRREPSGAALALLRVAAHSPAVVLKALRV